LLVRYPLSSGRCPEGPENALAPLIADPTRSQYLGLMKRSPRLAPLAVLALAVLALASCSSLPTFTAADLSTSVKVTDQGSWITLEPLIAPAKSVGVMYYPGGFVRPEAYELSLIPVVQAGYPVVIVKMPLDLAFFDAEKGLAARSALPAVKRWVIGGHSLGGVAAAIAVDKHPDAFAGIFFLASYPAGGNDLSKRSLPAISISASNDGLSTPAKVKAASAYLPSQTEVVVINGGNHAQFADYGPQKGDGLATLSREDQHAQMTQALVGFLGRISP
jgi:dienelactone hydrolase